MYLYSHRVFSFDTTFIFIVDFWPKAAVLIWKAVSADKKYHTFHIRKENAWRLEKLKHEERKTCVILNAISGRKNLQCAQVFDRKASSGSPCNGCSLYETYLSFLERSLEYSGLLNQDEGIPGQISIEMLENGRYMPKEER